MVVRDWFFRTLAAMIIYCVPHCAHCAQLVKFGPTLCGAGQLYLDGKCVAADRGRCPSGYYVANIDGVTYSAPTLQNNCLNAYNTVTMPDTMHPIYGGILVNFGPTLCGAGQIMQNGQCVEMDRGRCPAGYYTSNIDSVTYSAPTLQNNCLNTYNRVTMPEMFHPMYNGILVKFGPKLCGPGYDMVNGTCTARTQGRCPNGYMMYPVSSNTFSAQTLDLNCMNSYNTFEVPDILQMMYNGILVNFGPELCGAGMRMSDGACVPLERGECPENYYDATVDAETLMKTNMGKCDTNYSAYGLSANCGAATDAALCAILCDAPAVYTGVGTCATPCELGARRLNTSNGILVPLYSERQSTPTLNVLFPDGGMCYGNLVSGAARGSINMNYNNTIYHTTD